MKGTFNVVKSAEPMPADQDPSKSTLEQMRSVLFSNDSDAPLSEIVEFKGQRFEVRQLSIGASKAVNKAGLDKSGKEDQFKQVFEGIRRSVFVPGTDTLAIRASDEDAWMNKSANPEGLMMKLIKAFGRVNKQPKTEEEVEKNSDATGDDASSS